VSQESFDMLATQAKQVLQKLSVANVPDYASARLSISSQTLATPSEVRQTIAAFAPVCGWMMQTSAVSLWRADWNDANGALLAGEFARDNMSMHVRHGMAGWQVVTFSEGEGDLVMAHSHHFESVPTVNGATIPGHGLQYRVYQQESALGLRPFQARFIGFGGN